ncbi:hypothetical protein SLEP1_g23939 [Rubroshorea leprosula]|uniref:Uncharacterized protein n=1 Tax=Rubroshorea leprosula TaxID=152421 RepID=A0AAV5JLA0_9ROSI|nr:hypothetical protein SLEP1_g23939 [Rubroshorea leprosula]
MVYISIPLNMIAVEILTRQLTLKSCCCCWRCCCFIISFCLRSSRTLRWELECWVRTKVGLAAGRYSGTSRPDLYRTPQALQSVLGPSGPVRHCGVLSEAQCVHLLRSPSDAAGNWADSLFVGFGFPLTGTSFSGGINIDAVVFVPVVALDRLLLSLPANEALFCTVRVPASEFDGKSVNESSTNCDNHSSSATSSLFTQTKPKKKKKKLNIQANI